MTSDRPTYLYVRLSDNVLEEQDWTIYQKGKDFTAVDGPLIDATRRRVEATLAPHRLWRPECFGLWVALCVSY